MVNLDVSIFYHHIIVIWIYSQAAWTDLNLQGGSLGVISADPGRENRFDCNQNVLRTCLLSVQREADLKLRGHIWIFFFKISPLLWHLETPGVVMFLIWLLIFFSGNTFYSLFYNLKVININYFSKIKRFFMNSCQLKHLGNKSLQLPCYIELWLSNLH